MLGWLITLSAFDIRYRRLPNVLTLPGAAVIIAGAWSADHGGAAVLGAGTLFVLYATVHLIVPAGMGAGDVKLAIGLGALTGAFGPDVWALAALGAGALTGVLGLAALVGGTRIVPHGPSMCLASAVAVALAVT
ncbi:A24 family peptidase [Mycobacterium sp. Y57]|nr:A24 family peptidase [Mycolicibacterium xanthum]